MSDLLTPRSFNSANDSGGPSRADRAIGRAAPQRHRHGRFRIVLGNGFARDTVVVRYGNVEVARRCGVTTRSDGAAGVIFAEVPVGADNHHLDVEVVGRLLSGSVELPPPAEGDVTVEVDLDHRDLRLRSD